VGPVSISAVVTEIRPAPNQALGAGNDAHGRIEMANKHPYTVGVGDLTQTLNHLRRSFPDVVNSDTLKRLGVAANNASYIINTLRFVGIIDSEGKQTGAASTTFSQHENDDFSKSFSQMVKDAYVELFKLHGDGAWTIERSKLISFFRNADKTGAEVGRRQAVTFETLSTVAGRAGEKTKAVPASKAKAVPTKLRAKPANLAKLDGAPLKTIEIDADPVDKGSRDFALTVRIEINIPAEADQAHYDMMFRSIRENLINAK
jgi:hypothetical protein